MIVPLIVIIILFIFSLWWFIYCKCIAMNGSELVRLNPWMRRLQPPTMTHTAFHWKIEFALFRDRATSSTHRPKSRFQFHTVPRWPHIVLVIFLHQMTHTPCIFKENDPFASHKWRDKYARGQRSHRELRRMIREKNKINSNIYEITFLFMTLSCVSCVRVEWVALPTVGQFIITLTCFFSFLYSTSSSFISLFMFYLYYFLEPQKPSSGVAYNVQLVFIQHQRAVGR